MNTTVTRYPNNKGRKYCARSSRDGRKTTAWGSTEDEARKNVEEKLNSLGRKK